MNSIQWFDWGYNNKIITRGFDEFAKGKEDAVIGLKGFDKSDFNKIDLSIWFNGHGFNGFMSNIDKTSNKFPNTSFYKPLAAGSNETFIHFYRKNYGAQVLYLFFEFYPKNAEISKKFNKNSENYNTNIRGDYMYIQVTFPLKNGKQILDYSVKLSDKIYYYEFDFTK